MPKIYQGKPPSDRKPYKPSELFEGYMLLGSPELAAEEWIKGYSEYLSEGAKYMHRVSTAQLIQVAQYNAELTNDEIAHGMEEMLCRPQFLYLSLDPEFWSHLELVTNTKIPDLRRKNFFFW